MKSDRRPPTHCGACPLGSLSFAHVDRKIGCPFVDHYYDTEEGCDHPDEFLELASERQEAAHV
jgi:hypothetical protein